MTRPAAPKTARLAEPPLPAWTLPAALLCVVALALALPRPAPAPSDPAVQITVEPSFLCHAPAGTTAVRGGLEAGRYASPLWHNQGPLYCDGPAADTPPPSRAQADGVHAELDVNRARKPASE